MTGIDRRAFLRAVVVSSAGAALAPSEWQAAYAAPATPGTSPYGDLVGPDANGLLLPAGFRARAVAVSGQPVPGTTFVWPRYPDGAAIFPAPDGGWIYVANSEVTAGAGGASAIRFRPDGEVATAYSILRGTTGNCSGGATPWGTWLSCEEPHGSSHLGDGLVWECDPSGPGQGVVRPGLGRFNHEAAAVDPVTSRVYLTEDRRDGRFYRFTPARAGNLSAGTLEAAVVSPAGKATWIPVPDPGATTTSLRTQLPQATPFDRGEGCWHDSGYIYFVTTGDNRVWVHDLAAQTFGVLYDAGNHADPPLTGVDGVLVSSAHDVYVAEDAGSMEIVMISRERVVAPVVRYLGNQTSEVTGMAFDPSGQRLYFSSQRGPAPSGAGITFEVIGPFRQAVALAAPATTAPPTTAPTTTTPPPTASTAPPSTVALAELQAVAEPPPAAARPRSSSTGPLTLLAAGMAGTLWAALWRFRRTRAAGTGGDPSLRAESRLGAPTDHPR